MNSSQRRKWRRKVKRIVYRVAEEMSLEVQEGDILVSSIMMKQYRLYVKPPSNPGLNPPDDWEDEFGRKIAVGAIREDGNVEGMWTHWTESDLDRELHHKMVVRFRVLTHAI